MVPFAPSSRAVLATLAALAAACGGDRAEREHFEQVRAACGQAIGGTLGEAGAAMVVPAFFRPSCVASLTPLGATDTCPGAPGAYTGPVCVLAYEFCASGTSLCSSGPLGGCAFACEVRIAAASTGDLTSSSTICATRFISGQPIEPVSGRVCR